MWGISVLQDLYFSLVLAFRAGNKKTRSANHTYVSPLFPNASISREPVTRDLGIRLLVRAASQRQVTQI
ncbi:hypothetical protein Forpi1262_v016475 [Fusarium oxysporum f. sp. raphani]|uniref:Secreted protein n=1 Tax=Fusarium oxysporum f. sp. raphani TaxID=96318 RepID=A0A8J5P433_FUSOX|nr:hypothetical protein Forpi1262_v016475 [Fusarium oxysporum f. sp. raphani]